MTQLLDKYSKIITARITVPANTLSTNPYTYKMTSQLPIVESIKVFMWSPAAGVTPIETGWKVSSGSIDLIPSMGGFDSLSQDVYAPVLDSFPFEADDINAQLGGPPYELDFKFYNSDAAVIAYYFIQVKTAPKIDLPLALITSDAKKKPNDND